MRVAIQSALIGFLLLSFAPAAFAQDAAVSAPFKEGDVITFDKIDKLKDFLPKEFWANRRFFFHEGMKMEIGPFQRDYSPAKEYVAASKRFKGQARIGPEESLENYIAGSAFPIDEIDCNTDPQAGTKIIWNFQTMWAGGGTNASFMYSYWDRGERMPLFYEGASTKVHLANRVEKGILDGPHKGDVFPNEKRISAFNVEIAAPFDVRGTLIISYRYKSSMLPPGKLKDDDMWVYVPSLRRVRRISTAQRSDPISGTDFSIDDINSFNGLVPEYKWKCLGEMDVIAPINTKYLGYPKNPDRDFGPHGLSLATDRWEVRRAVGVRFTPKRAGHPYHHKDILLDKQTMLQLYSFAYDHKGTLWKILQHNGRWSGDGTYYKGWDGISTPRDLHPVGDVVLNVQTGTGNRIEFYDFQGEPMTNKAKIRRYIDVGRLNQGH